MNCNNVHDTKMAHKNMKCQVSLCDYSDHATNKIPFLFKEMLECKFTFHPQKPAAVARFIDISSVQS
jgi:hypothetical protein